MEYDAKMNRIAVILFYLPLSVVLLACATSPDAGGLDEQASTVEPQNIEADWSVEDNAAIARALQAHTAAQSVLETAEDPADPETRALADEAAAAALAKDVAPLGSDELVAILAAELPVPMASTYGMACRAACWGAASMGCAAVSGMCTGAAMITIGSTAIPCLWAVIAACGAVGVGGSVCSDQCPL